MDKVTGQQKSLELAYRAQEVLEKQIKLYLVYIGCATEDYVTSGIVVGAETPEEAYEFWDGDYPGTVSVCELPVKPGVIAELDTLVGQESSRLNQDKLPETHFKYLPKKVSV